MRFDTWLARATTALCFFASQRHFSSGFGVVVVPRSFTNSGAGTSTGRRSSAVVMSATSSTSAPAPSPAVKVVPAKAPLPLLDDGITVVSFNVLLPNGNDGWWMYKSYQPHVPEEHRVWPFRKALMREYLLSKEADVVCVQEASAESFESDFDFMKDAGYDCVLHSKFRFRSATFFKTSRLELVCEKHKDRVLVTGLRTLADATVTADEEASPQQPARPPPPPPPDSNPSVDPTAAAAASTVASNKEAPLPRLGASDSVNSGRDVTSESGPPVVEARVTTAVGKAVETRKDGGGPDESVEVLKATTENSKGSHGGRKGRLVMVVNCHLTGGPVPERRMRQVFDGLDTARKEAAKVLKAEAAEASRGQGMGKGQKNGKKAGGKGAGSGAAGATTPGTSVPVVVCGDFNGHGRTAVWELLTAGVVEASFREPGYPETAVTSKDKRHGFGPFGDVYEEAYGGECQAEPRLEGVLDAGDAGRGSQRGNPTAAGHPPPTFIVPLLHPHFLGENGEGVSPRLQVALSEAFYSLVERYGSAAVSPGSGAVGDDAQVTVCNPTPDADRAFLSRQGVEAWLLTINRGPRRGSEFRAAEAIMGPGPGGGLTLEDFFTIYAMELREGKFWGVAHDLHALGVELPGGIPWLGPYTARFDRVFYSKATLEAVGAMEPLNQEEMELVAGGDCLPNSWHPSDHLAVAGVFRFR